MARFSKAIIAAAALLIAQPVSAALPSPSVGQLPTHTLAQYGSDIVLRFNISSNEELTSLNEAVGTLLLDVWGRRAAQRQMDIRLNTDTVPLLLGLLPESLQTAHEPLLQERALVDAIADTYQSVRHRKFDGHVPSFLQKPVPGSHDETHEEQANDSGDVQGIKDDVFFQNYQPLSALQPWMQLLASLYSDHTSLVTIGQSAEGRPIQGLRVGVTPAIPRDVARPRKTILIVGGLHAREWIGTSTVTYLADYLVKSYGHSDKVSRLLEHFDFVLVPTLNPDGYEYTWTTDRLWRKTRQETDTRFCPGIDLDRSFDFAWQARDNTCSESFPGDAPLAAVEAAALASWAQNQTENNNVVFQAFVDLHAYSETILYPYSYTCDKEPPSLENLEELAAGLRRSIIDIHGHRYSLMPACEENLFAASPSTTTEPELAGGSALDYFYHVRGVRYSYQIKLRDRGSYGFLLPREHIIPTGKEITNAVIFMADFLRDADSGDDDDDDDDDEILTAPKSDLRRRWL
jgi:extracellular matrix protein 14